MAHHRTPCIIEEARFGDNVLPLYHLRGAAPARRRVPPVALPHATSGLSPVLAGFRCLSLLHCPQRSGEGPSAPPGSAVLRHVGPVPCILIEDISRILVLDASSFANADHLPLYISERNFSENILLLALS